MADSESRSNTQRLYLAYGRALTTDVALPELPAASSPAPSTPEWTVRQVAVIHPQPGTRWSVLWRAENKTPWATSGSSSNTVYLRFGRFADFALTGQLIEVARRGFATRATVRHLLLDQVLPLSLALTGEVVLHAASAAMGNAQQAIVVCGSAGAGKSTIVSALARRGCGVLADDGVMVLPGEVVTVVPSYPGLRLWPDSVAALSFGNSPLSALAEYTQKRRVTVDTSAPVDPRPVRDIYVLEPSPRLEIARLDGHAALLALVRHAYRHDLADRDALRLQLAALQRIASRVRVWALRVPRDFARLTSAADTLLAHASRRDGDPVGGVVD